MKNLFKQVAFFSIYFVLLLFAPGTTGQILGDTIVFMDHEIVAVGDAELEVKTLNGREYLVIRGIGERGNDGFLILANSDEFVDTEIAYRDPIYVDQGFLSVYKMTNLVLSDGEDALMEYSSCEYRRWVPGQLELTNYFNVSRLIDQVEIQVQYEREIYSAYEGQEGLVGQFEIAPAAEEIPGITMSIDRHNGDAYELYHEQNFYFMPRMGKPVGGDALLLKSEEALENRPIGTIRPYGILVNIGNIGVDSVVVRSIKSSPSRAPIFDSDPLISVDRIKKLSVFPNPARDIINVGFKERARTYGIIEVYNDLRLMYTRRISTDKSISIDVSTYPPGKYYVRFISTTGRATEPTQWIKL